MYVRNAYRFSGSPTLSFRYVPGNVLATLFEDLVTDLIKSLRNPLQASLSLVKLALEKVASST